MPNSDPWIKTKEKRKITDIIIDTLLPSVLVIWYIFLYFQLIVALIEGNYSVYFNYAQITLTLFGFTLLGTFFEHIKKDKDAIKKLVKINLWFLLSAIGFLIVYAVTGFIYFPVLSSHMSAASGLSFLGTSEMASC